MRRCAACLRPLLVLTDGWSAYPNSIRRAFREKVKLTGGVGRACLQVWPELHIGTVIKRTEKKRVVEITRQIAHGLLEQSIGQLAITRPLDHSCQPQPRRNHHGQSHPRNHLASFHPYFIGLNMHQIQVPLLDDPSYTR